MSKSRNEKNKIKIKRKDGDQDKEQKSMKQNKFSQSIEQNIGPLKKLTK